MENDQNLSATQVIEKHRAGLEFDDETYRNTNNTANVQKLRAEIDVRDTEWITKMLAAESPAQRKFALDMTKILANDAAIKQGLQKMWQSETEQETIQSLIFALLNIEELSEKTHREVFGWIKVHLAEFKTSVAKWYGGEDKVLRVIRQREKDPSFIRKKKWIYLCCALAAGEGQKQEAREFILALPGNGNNLTEQVRQFALAQFDDKSAASVA